MGFTDDVRTLGRERLAAISRPMLRAYRYQRINWKTHNVVPAALVAAVAGLLLAFAAALPRVATLFFELLGFLLFVWISYLVWPIVRYQARGFDIDREMHLFITRMGVLASAEASRREILEVFGHMREYGVLASEVEKIYALVTRWNVSLERSARLTARDCPSQMFGDFLLRLAHAVETGETAEEFFRNEQIVVMDQYKVKYEAGLRGVELLKELFVALVTSLLFVMVVITITPFLTKADISASLGLSILFFFAFELAVLWLVRALVPGESLWHKLTMKTKVHTEVRRRFRAGLVMVLAILLPLGILDLFMYYTELGTPIRIGAWQGILPGPDWPLGPAIPGELVIAIALIPLMFPSAYIALREADIMRRDEMYPTFIRSLGGAVGARSKSITLPLKRLRFHDFGPLSENIEALYRRLSMRINSKRAWDFFGAESLSELVSKFNEMYVEGARIGGDTRRISRIVSENFLKILGLRKAKFESASTFLWTLYGVTIALAFTLYFMLFVVEAFHTSFARLFQSEGLRLLFENPPAGGLGFLSALRNPPFDFGLFRVAIFCVILGHSAISAAMVQFMSGGKVEGSLTHFVGMTWTGVLTAMIVTWAVRAGGLFTGGP